MKQPNWGSIWRRSAIVIATGAGTGFVRFMPGTIGGLWGLPLSWGLAALPHVGLQIGAIVLLVAVGIPICSTTAVHLGVKDPSCVVWDEISTVPIAFLFVDRALLSNPWVLLAGFLMHRLFDITKPPPANYLEKLPGGAGIMLDDCAAGIYACVALHMLLKTAALLGMSG